jgi:phospholipid/cholesterol/gamma-HCH transport system substrate-binding protein
MRRTRLAVALLSLGMALSGCSLTGSQDAPDVVAYFKDVGDLVPGAQVQVNDVKVGRVTDISLLTQGTHLIAKVSMVIDPSGKIPADGLKAAIRQTSLLGEQFVQLIPTRKDAPFLGTAQVSIPVGRTDRRVDVETFLGDLSSFVGGGGLEDLNRFTHAQAMILEDRGRRFGDVLDELDKFTGVLAGRRYDIGAAIDSLASATGTLASNKSTLDSFLNSLDQANGLLAKQGNQLGRLFRGLHRFGTVNTKFLAQHESAINRQFTALRPIFDGLAGAQGDLRVDITQLKQFFQLFPKSLGEGPGSTGRGDYIQVDAVLCEALANCHTKGEKGNVPGQGS